MSNLYLMVGMPASGKTTYIRNNFPDVIRVCHDDLYRMMTATWLHKVRDAYHRVEDAAITAMLKAGYDVVIDRTCLDKVTRRRFVELAKEYDADVTAIVMETPLDIAKIWNINSDRIQKSEQVPLSVYDKMLEKVESVTEDEGFRYIIRINPLEDNKLESRPILCLDFDGVLHSYISGWHGADRIPDPPVEGAFEFLEEAVKHFSVHVFSYRSGYPGGIEAMRSWFKKWQNNTDILYNLHFPRDKPPAKITIDDRAITFTGKWPDIQELINFRPWNKK